MSEDKEIIYRELQAFLVGDTRFEIGAIKLPNTEPILKFAGAAYRKIQGSAKRLMQPKWKIVIVDEDGREHGFGLETWNKLTSQEDREAKVKRAVAREREKLKKQGILA